MREAESLYAGAFAAYYNRALANITEIAYLKS